MLGHTTAAAAAAANDDDGDAGCEAGYYEDISSDTQRRYDQTDRETNPGWLTEGLNDNEKQDHDCSSLIVLYITELRAWQ